MPDRLPRKLTPKERLAQVAAILARGVARYLRNSRPGADHNAIAVPHRSSGGSPRAGKAAQTLPPGP